MTRIGVRPPLQITTMGPVSEAESDEVAWAIEPVLSRARSRAGHGAGRLRTPCPDPRGRAQPEAGLSVEMSDRRPPLIFDDPFVTLDDGRATRALELIRAVAADFQVIYLTTSDRYDSAADAIVELPGPTAVDDEPAPDEVVA